MQETTGFLNLPSNKTMFYRHWECPGAQSVVCPLHDLGGHSGSFSRLAESLYIHNNAVFAIDFTGHGNTSGKKGHLFSYEIIYQQIEYMLAEVRSIYGNTPVILYGQGLGANFALNYYFSKKTDIQGIVTSSPWFKLCEPPMKFLISLAEAFQFVFPSISFPSGFRAEDLTQDEAYLKEMEKDVLRHNKISLKLFTQAYNHGRKIAVQGYRISRPMLLMHGSEDKITSHRTSREFSRNTGTYTTFVSIQNGNHELHNDIVKEEVFRTVNQWIDEKILNKS